MLAPLSAELIVLIGHGPTVVLKNETTVILRAYYALERVTRSVMAVTPDIMPNQQKILLLV